MANIWTKEQNEAINEEGTNIIVSAGAGSGKTAVLTERVIRKLKDKIGIDKLLILTFTNMAAKEMKDRIRKKIKEDKSLINELNYIDSAFITTFDSYALSIVKKYHYILNISSNISITDSSIISIEKNKILTNVFDKLYEQKDPLFVKLITDFCVKNDESIKNYILNINNKLDMKYDKINYLNNYLNNYYNDNNLDSLIEQYNNLLLSIINNIKSNLEELSFLVETKYYEDISVSLIGLLNSKDYKEIKQNINIKLPSLYKNSTEEAKIIKKNISELIKNLNTYCSYEDEFRIKESLLLTKDYVDIIIRILIEYDKELTKYKENNELFEFVDIAKLAIKLVKENPSIKAELKNSYNEIMIDEYQDTNDLQEEFISTISNNNVYMVGDIKQSIYKFRNANSYLFKNKYNNYSSFNGGIKIDLNKNFRSREEVINNINLIFNNIMTDTIGGADYINTHQMSFGNNVYNNFKTNQNNNFEIINYSYNKDTKFSKLELEVFIIANDIKNKINNNYQIFDNESKSLRNATYKDFVILVDRLSESDTYKKIFEYLNIPLTIYKDNIITNSIIFDIVKNIINLIIKTRENNYDTSYKYSFLSIGRSFLFSYSDDYLFNIITNNKYKETSLYIIIEKISKQIDYLNIKDLLINIINEFNIYESLIKIGNIEENIININYLKDLATNLSNMGYTIYDFNDYIINIKESKLEIKYLANKKDSNSVLLMTIHRSKGLEYSICYYNLLYKEFNLSDLKDKILYDDKYGIVTSYFEEGLNETIVKSLVKENYYQEELSERIRLFYVALTRAKEKMIIITDNIDESKIKDKYKCFKDILSKILVDLNSYITTIDLDTLNLTKDYNNIKNKNILIKNNNENIIVNELNLNTNIMEESSYSKKTNKIINKEEKKLLKLGEDVHYILETIDFKNPNLDIVDERIKSYILLFLNSDLMKNVKKSKVYKEYEFIYKQDNNIKHGIIDLMLEYSDHIDIIDYKLKSIDDENYLKQLNGYKSYINNITNKDVSIYLYSIMDNKYKKLD